MSTLDKILCIMLIGWVLNIPVLLMRFMQINYGTPEVPLYPVFFFGIPAGIAIVRALMAHRLALPYIRAFLLLVISYAVIEYATHSIERVASFDFLKNITIFYALLVAILNVSRHPQMIRMVINWSIIFITTSVLFNYLWYLDIISLAYDQSATTQIDDSEFVRFGLDGVLHPNGLSLTGSICIALILLSDHYKAFRFAGWVKITIVLLCLGILVLNASRGAFLITLAVLLIYLFYRWGKVSLGVKLFSIIAIAATLLVFQAKIEQILAYSYLNERLTSETSSNEARVQQVRASMNNFIANPFSGNGWNYAAQTAQTPQLRISNFLYTQILGASGIIVFVFFLVWQFQLFGTGITKKISLSIALFLLFGFSAWMFYNLRITLPLCIIAVLSFYERNQSYLPGSTAEEINE